MDVIAGFCEKSVEVKQNNQYRVVNMTYLETEITVVSHGVGILGASYCFDELIRLGVRVIIKCGTCEILKPKEIKSGDLMISRACTSSEDPSQ